MTDHTTQGEIQPESGAVGGGWTDGNLGAHNSRKTNEDRAIITRTSTLKDDTKAQAFLKDMITNHIVPATRDIQGGSTLSIALAMGDGKFACAHIGDSPIYILAENTDGDVKLVPVALRHGVDGDDCRLWMQSLSPNQRPQGLNADILLEKWRETLKDSPDILLVVKRYANMITRNLGAAGTIEDNRYTPDIYTVDAQAECPEGFSPKAILVCSDGVEKGVKKVTTPMALANVMGRNPNAETLATAMVNHTIDHTTDNITVTVMPINAPAGNLIAVADGNYNTAEVAETAVECIREVCRERLGTSTSVTSVVANAAATQDLPPQNLR
jgi:serine/threonine protein phosphatase PrpC